VVTDTRRRINGERGERRLGMIGEFLIKKFDRSI
jgi:hypothetical protein